MLEPPTSRLPAIGNLKTCRQDALLDALSYLRGLYSPGIRGAKRKFRRVAFHWRCRGSPSVTGPQHQEYSSTCDLDDLDDLRSDTFERSYSLRWLTALLANFEDEEAFDEEVNYDQGNEIIIQEAASILALCSGTAGAGIVSRHFIFRPTIRKSEKAIHVELCDVPLENQDYESVGAQTWGGACVLSADIVDSPERFGLSGVGRPLRVLELGAGTGLVCLTVGKILQALPHLRATIVATDFYPLVLANLERNIKVNFLPPPPPILDGIDIQSISLDWSKHAQLPSHPPPLHQPFDLVLGADIIYEDGHAEWIKSCLEHLLRHPDDSCDTPVPPAFHLVIPLRRTHKTESGSIEVVFPFAGEPSKETQLAITRKEIITCDGGDGIEDIDYAYYCIEWC